MLEVSYTTRFKKDIKLAKKRRKPLRELQKVMKLIAEEKDLPAKYKNHKLSGIYLLNEYNPIRKKEQRTKKEKTQYFSFSFLLEIP